MLIYGNKKTCQMEPSWFLIRELIFSYAQLTLMHIFCAVNSIYWLTLGGGVHMILLNQSDFAMTPANHWPRSCQIWNLDPFSAVWSCQPIAAPTCPSSTLHLTSSYTGIKMNKYQTKGLSECVHLMHTSGQHTRFSRRSSEFSWLSGNGGEKCGKKQTNLIHKVINLDWLFFLLDQLLLFSLFYHVLFI